jgi:hypothetical protein
LPERQVSDQIRTTTPEGKVLAQFGSLGRKLGQMVRPKGIAIDSMNNVYVADAATEVVQLFNDKAKLLLFFGGNRGTPDSLYLPAGLHITNDPEMMAAMAPRIARNFDVKYVIVAVSQYGKNRISIFGFGSPK